MRSKLDELSSDERVRIAKIAKELSNYGLGIFQPHAHDAQGNLIQLSSGDVSLERDLQVAFVSKANVPSDAIEVGWRWMNGSLQACANCCGRGP